MYGSFLFKIPDPAITLGCLQILGKVHDASATYTSTHSEMGSWKFGKLGNPRKLGKFWYLWPVSCRCLEPRVGLLETPPRWHATISSGFVSAYSWTMPINTTLISIDTNVVLIGIEKNWSALISIDQHWSLLIDIDLYWLELISIDWNWPLYLSALISIYRHWSLFISIDLYWLELTSLFIGIDLYLSALISIYQHWSLFIIIDLYWSALISIDWHWSLLIGIGINAN